MSKNEFFALLLVLSIHAPRVNAETEIHSEIPAPSVEKVTNELAGSLLKKPELDRTFSFSSGYLDQTFHSSDGLSEFPLSVLNVYSYLYDQVTQSWALTPGKRALSFLISFPVADWIGSGLTLGFHEFGHARAVNALGGSYFYSVPFYNETNISNYWTLSFWLLLTPPPDIGGEVPYTNYVAGLQVPSGTSAYYGGSGADILVAAAGINNSTFLSNKIAQQIYRTGGHVANWQTYYLAKLDGMFYPLFTDASRPGNDISGLVRGYQSKGYNITSGQIAGQYALGLLSGTSLATFKGIYDYIAHGDPVIHSLEWQGIRFPEFNSYLNARGLSFEVTTGFRFSEHLIVDLAYEWITAGDFTQQLTPRIGLDLAVWFPALNSFWLSLEGVIGAGFGNSLEAAWFPYMHQQEGFLSRLSYGLKWTNYNRYNLYGERNSPSLMGGDVYSQLIGTVQFHY